MKTILSKLTLLLLIYSVLLIVSCSPKDKPEKELRPALAATAPSFLGLPFSWNEVASITGQRNLNVFIKAAVDPGASPIFINSEIYLTDLNEYLASDLITYPCFRLYSAIEGSKVFNLLCLADDDGNEKPEYIKLDKREYKSGEFKNAKKLTVDEAKSLTTDFHTKIVYFDQYTPTKKQSRIYLYSEFKNLMTNNQIDTLGGSVQIEIGYINKEAANSLAPRLTRINQSNNRGPVSAIQMQGMTSLICLIDSVGNPIIDINAVQHDTDYTKRALEVGTPCPPRCGALNQ